MPSADWSLAETQRAIRTSAITLSRFAPDVREGALGLILMRSFSSQLGGELAVLSDKGTTIQLTVLDAALHGQTDELPRDGTPCT